MTDLRIRTGYTNKSNASNYGTQSTNQWLYLWLHNTQSHGATHTTQMVGRLASAQYHRTYSPSQLRCGRISCSTWNSNSTLLITWISLCSKQQFNTPAANDTAIQHTCCLWHSNSAHLLLMTQQFNTPAAYDSSSAHPLLTTWISLCSKT